MFLGRLEESFNIYWLYFQEWDEEMMFMSWNLLISLSKIKIKNTNVHSTYDKTRDKAACSFSSVSGGGASWPVATFTLEDLLLLAGPLVPLKPLSMSARLDGVSFPCCSAQDRTGQQSVISGLLGFLLLPLHVCSRPVICWLSSLCSARFSYTSLDTCTETQLQYFTSVLEYGEVLVISI